jgi:hypothetical protein
MAALRREVGAAGLVVAFISPTFQTRAVCIAELGAAWAQTGRLFPLLLPGVERSALEGVLQGLAVRYINEGPVLDELRDIVGSVTGRTTSSATWNRFREEWLSRVDQLNAGLARSDARPTLFARRLEELGLINFFASRADYGVYRPPGTIVGYLDTAESRIDIAAYWLAHGNEAESIARSLVEILERKPRLRMRIAMIDPNGPHVGAIAEYLAMRTVEMSSRLESSLDNLVLARGAAGESARSRMDILTYSQMPAASVIMLDYGTSRGRIQLDFKPFQRPRSESFSFELAAPSALYTRCSDAWMALIDRGVPYEREITSSPDSATM